MTIIAGCHFSDGIVVMSDSRITLDTGRTRVYQDVGQKVLSLGKKLAFAYSGHVKLAGKVAEKIRKRIKTDRNFRFEGTLIRKTARIAK